jgi:hypothetical protein
MVNARRRESRRRRKKIGRDYKLERSRSDSQFVGNRNEYLRVWELVVLRVVGKPGSGQSVDGGKVHVGVGPRKRDLTPSIRCPEHEAVSCQNHRSSASAAAFHIAFLQSPRTWIMDPKFQPKWHDNALSALNLTIEGLNLAKEISSVTPAKAVFGSVSVLLTMIMVCLPLCEDESPIDLHPGVDDQSTGLRRTRIVLR